MLIQTQILRVCATLSLLLMVWTSAEADIWRWTDANGVVRYVTSDKPLYTWSDETGKVHYSDAPDHEDAIRVELVWHAKGKQLYKDGEDLVADSMQIAANEPAESAAERYAREQQEAQYCKRAQEVYDSYLNAPRLYETNDDGEREYLNDRETRKLLAETKATVRELCN